VLKRTQTRHTLTLIMEDIEDLASAQELGADRILPAVVQPKRFHARQQRHAATVTADDAAVGGQDLVLDSVVSTNLTPKKELSNVSEDVQTHPTTDEKHQSTSVVPGTQKVFLRTWGCSHNNSDGEYMAGQLASFGYQITQNRDEADLWLLNSCTVKNPSEQSFTKEINLAKAAGKKVVLAGCVSQAQPTDFVDYSIIGVQQIDRVVEVVEETLQGHSVQLLGQRKDGGARLHLPKIRKNPFVEIVPINTGCLNQCTYCKTKHARGDLRSYVPEEIVERVDSVFKEGVVEVWLTSEDLGTYGRDISVSLPDLMWRIIEILPPNVMLRCGMTNPPYIMEHLDEMAKILNHPQVYSFLHLPLQAASDSVLHNMRRKYTCAEFCHVADVLLERVPDMHIATDIICGFPGETAEDFAETLSIIDKYRFPTVNISQFYPRPGTPAARMKRVNTKEVKQRSRELTKLFYSYETRGKKVGLIERVLCTGVAHDGIKYECHNKGYDQVLVVIPERFGLDQGDSNDADGTATGAAGTDDDTKGGPVVKESRNKRAARVKSVFTDQDNFALPLIGKMFYVKYTKAHKFCLIGEIIPDSVAEANAAAAAGPGIRMGQVSQVQFEEIRRAGREEEFDGALMQRRTEQRAIARKRRRQLREQEKKQGLAQAQAQANESQCCGSGTHSQSGSRPSSNKDENGSCCNDSIAAVPSDRDDHSILGIDLASRGNQIALILLLINVLVFAWRHGIATTTSS
jgi:threonylcarbamoyladenosine tRNA methylthiotransferase CDKAL1